MNNVYDNVDNLMQGTATGCYVDQNKITYGEDVSVENLLYREIIMINVISPMERTSQFNYIILKLEIILDNFFS